MFPSKLLHLELSPTTSFKSEDNSQPMWTLQQSDFDKELEVRPFYSHKKEQMRRQLIEEVDRDGDNIMTECNRILNQQDTNIPAENLDDLFKAIAINEPQQKENKIRFYGRLKFFDEQKNYGFIVMDSDGSDIFVYADDLAKTGLPREYLRTAKHGNIIRFQFTCMNYVGKYNQSRKAIDLEYLKVPAPVPPMRISMPYYRIPQCTF